MLRRRHAIAAVVFVTCRVSVGLAEESAKVAPLKSDSAQRAVRTDRSGDPLPPDAIRRLGTVRLRHGSCNRLSNHMAKWYHTSSFPPMVAPS